MKKKIKQLNWTDFISLRNTLNFYNGHKFTMKNKKFKKLNKKLMRWNRKRNRNVDHKTENSQKLQPTSNTQSEEARYTKFYMKWYNFCFVFWIPLTKQSEIKTTIRIITHTVGVGNLKLLSFVCANH